MSKSLISGLKVLLADDSVTMHRAVTLALKKLSCELLLADNGSDAERILREERPDIVLLDWDLPEKSGIELCRDIKSDPEIQQTKVVLLLSSFEKMDEDELNTVPSDARLWKPFEANVLQTMIETLVKNSEMGQSSSTASVVIESTSPQRSKLSGNSPTGGFEDTGRPSYERDPTTPPPASQSGLRLGKVTAEATSPKLPPKSPSPTVPPKAAPSTPPTKPSMKSFAVEATVPPLPKTPPPTAGKKMSIDDLFKSGAKKTPPIADEEELSKELTEETFRPAAFPESASAGTRESDISEHLVESEDDNVHGSMEMTSADQESFANMQQTIDEARHRMQTSSSQLWEGQGATSLPPLPKGSPKVEKVSLPKRVSAEVTSPGQVPPGVPGATSTLGAEEIRRLISDELETKFRAWLKEEVESQLARVLKELDG